MPINFCQQQHETQKSKEGAEEGRKSRGDTYNGGVKHETTVIWGHTWGQQFHI